MSSRLFLFDSVRALFVTIYALPFWGANEKKKKIDEPFVIVLMRQLDANGILFPPFGMPACQRTYVCVKKNQTRDTKFCHFFFCCFHFDSRIFKSTCKITSISSLRWAKREMRLNDFKNGMDLCRLSFVFMIAPSVNICIYLHEIWLRRSPTLWQY